MPKMVADSNFIVSDEAQEYLRASPQNFLILPEPIAVEGYASKYPMKMFESARGISQHPHQVLLLRATSECFGIIRDAEAHRELLLDKNQTNDFRHFSSLSKMTGVLHPNVVQMVDRNGAEAQYRLARIREDEEKMYAGLIAMQDDFSERERKMIRKGLAMKEELIAGKICGNARSFAVELASAHPSLRYIPFETINIEAFVFRYALCAQLLLVKWIKDNSPNLLGSKRIVNDQIDIIFATCALYYDGLLTKDNRLSAIYTDARMLLSRI
jgi:hypothetical protein